VCACMHLHMCIYVHVYIILYVCRHVGRMYCRGVHPLKPMNDAYGISPYFHNICKYPSISAKCKKCPLVSFNLHFFCLIYFCAPLCWPWRIYASCFTHTGHHCMYVRLHACIILNIVCSYMYVGPMCVCLNVCLQVLTCEC